MPEKAVLRVEFPMGGRNDSLAYQNQPPYTAVAARNVWPLASNRKRGGSRPGFTRVFASALGASPVGMTSLSYINSGEIVTKLAVITSAGTLYVGTTGLSSVGSVSVPVNNVLTMCERDQQLYIATRETPAVYDPSAGTLTNLVGVNGGTVPEGCTCICCWRDRIVLAGGTTDPYGVFMSRQSDPEDWDYTKLDQGAAVDLALAYAGQIGEIVTALVPHADTCLIIGCPTSIWMLQGDPLVGGSLVNLSQSIGIVDANAWCTTPDGMLVFLSADGLYMIPAGCSSEHAPLSISREKLPIALLNIDNRVTSSGKIVSLAYDTRWRGVHICVADRAADSSTPYYSAGGILHSVAANLSSSTSSNISNNVHWFLDWETKALFEVQYTSGAFDPWCCHARKNTPSSESVVVFGCRDGYVRYYLSTATTDDYGYTGAVKFPSYVVMGPLTDDPDLSDNVRADELELTLSTGSGSVDWALFRGNSPEESLANIEAVQEAASGRVKGGRNPRSYPRAAGTALYLMLSSSSAWAFESCRLLLTRLGRTRL